MKPNRVDNLPDAIYWASDKFHSSIAIASGAYMMCHGGMSIAFLGFVLILIGCL